MKRTKNNLRRAGIMLLLSVLTSFMAVSTSFAAAGNPTSGTCGDNDAPEALTWSFNMDSGTLTISGNGAMLDYESASATPWYSWASNINSIELGEGITRIGNYAFCGLPLKSILPQTSTSQSRKKADGGDEPVASVLPDGLMTIGNYALSGTQITSLTLPVTVTNIGEAALSQNSKLTSLTCLAVMTLPSFEGDILEGCTALTAIYVPETVVDDYKSLDCWQQYATLIQAIPEQGDEPSGDDEPTEPATVTIGKAQYGGAVPLTAQYKYSLSQQVFSANEINHPKGKIWSIAFNTKTGDLTRNYSIYLTHTDQSSLSSYDWQPVTAADCYFSGDVTFTSGQWVTIYFDKPFEYDGKSNIVVTVDDNTGRADGWGALSVYIFYGDGNHVTASDNSKDIDPLDAESIENAQNKGSQTYKNQIQFAFGDYPAPAYLAVTEIGDVSANVQCSLRGEAKAWNVRYRKVAAEGEEEQRYIAENNITTRSFTIEGLTANTKYEVQVQGVFAAETEGVEDKLSAWTEPLVFTTNCCPVEDQAEIMFALNSYGGNVWYDFAVQIMDVTDGEHPVEVAHLSSPEGRAYGGTLNLCCGHKYQVNWIYDADLNHANNNKYLSFALYYDIGDKLFIMNRGEAPEETAELTTFVMDCTPYCTQMPQALNEAGTTYESATITFVSQTKTGQVVYSTEADFDPEKATPEDVDFEELPQSDDPWGGTPPNASLTLKGLQPLTAYYVRVRSVCTVEPIGRSRWSEPIKVITGSRYDAPTQVIAEPVNSRTEKLSWSSRGNEKSHNLYYRKQAVGNPVDPSAIQTFGSGKGTGFEDGSWGEGIWSSYGDRPFSNTVFVTNVPAGSSFGFNAGNGKTGAGQTKFLYGMQKLKKDGTPLEQMKKFDKKCLNDADRAAIIKELQNKIKELTDEQQIAAYNAEIEELNSLPTDNQKLEKMRALEQLIKDKNVAKAELTLKFVNGEITQEQYESEINTLELANAVYKAQLSELRAIITNAENPQKDGFSITRQEESANQARTRGGENETYIFFIRHSDPNGVLLVKDLAITPPEQLGEWTVISNISKTEYTLNGLEPGTAYEVMVEPIYEDGTTGSQSPITVFTTLGKETEPTEGVFAVSKDKKVQFARGNLRYEGDIYGYESEWTMAKQQYEVLGEENIDNQGEWSFQKYPTDLLCWSTTNNYYGVSTYYMWEPDEIKEAFKGDFVDWGSNPTLISQLGQGWSTLSKDEWNYLLNERENAAQLKSFATITIDAENKVKGLVILPDEWDAPDGVLLSNEMTTEQWAAVEQTGAVFLPVTGHLWTWKDDQGRDQASVNGLDVIGNYWSSTPSAEESGDFACALNFNTEVVPGAEIERNLGCAVRLVKAVTALLKGDANNDGKVNADDIAAIVDYIMKGKTEGFNFEAADMNGDQKVNATDLVLLVKEIAK